MRNTPDIPVRLQAANPVPGLPAIAPPPELLARITSSPRDRVRRRNALVRRPLLVALVALLLAGGIALAANISVRYFGDAGSQTPPGTVRKALAFAASHMIACGQCSPYRLALTDTVAAYSFSAESANGTVYMAPYLHNSGFCAALAVPGRPARAGCMPGYGQSIATTTMSGFQPWRFAFTPDVHALLGRLAPSAAGSSVHISFEDGTHENVATHGRLFAYAVSGERTMAGHRPIRVSVIHGGIEVWNEQLNPVNYNTLAEARALVPGGDDSLGQRAVRRMLLAGLTTRQSDGGDLASHTDIAFTKLVARVDFGHGVTLSLYGTPVRPMRTWIGLGGSLVVGVVGHSTTAVVNIADQHVQPRRPSFSPMGPWGGSSSLPGHPDMRFVYMLDGVPRAASAVSVRTADGREQPATIFDNGREWVWAGREDPGTRPVAVIGRDAAGAVVASKRVHGW